MADAQDQASDVGAEEGHVTVDGPGGVVVTLTPDAALETSDRLRNAGMAANDQRSEAEQDPNADRFSK